MEVEVVLLSGAIGGGDVDCELPRRWDLHQVYQLLDVGFGWCGGEMQYCF